MEMLDLNLVNTLMLENNIIVLENIKKSPLKLYGKK